MALHNLRISSIVYDDAANTLTLSMLGEMPAPPDNVREDLWYPSPASFTVVVPVKKGAIKQASAVYAEEATADRYSITHNGTAWGNPVPVDELGKTKGK